MSAVPCHVCAAPFDDDTALYCRSCGAKRAAGVADLEAYRTGRERYELVTRQPAYEAAQRWRPRLRFGHEVGRPLLMMVLGGGFGVLFLATVRLVRAPAYFTWVGVGIVGGFLLVALLQTLLGIRRLLARSERAVAVVMDDRAGGDELVAPHLVDLRFIDGSRRKVRGAGDVMGAVAVGDIGVAYLQADRLVDFRWFDVMPAPLPPGALPRPPVCAACAAPLTLESRRDCAFCGAALAEPELGEHGARFAAIAARPATAGLLARWPGGGLPPVTAPAVIFALGVVGLAGLAYLHHMLVFFYETWRWGLLVGVPPVLMTAIGGLWLQQRLVPYRAPRLRALALILRTRRVRTGTLNDQPIYAFYATLRAASGARRELRCLPEVAAKLEVGEIGVAGVRGAWLTDFTVPAAG